MPHPLETRRLYLRPFEECDIDDALMVLQDIPPSVPSLLTTTLENGLVSGE